MNPPKEYMTPTEVGRMLKVSPVTVRYWASSGLLDAVTTPGGHRRFMRDEVIRFAKERGVDMGDLSFDSLRILIVDDDPQVTEVLKELLTTHTSCVVETANDGFEAGRLVPIFHPNLVLLDVMMPGLNGAEVCRRLKRDPLYRHIRIVAMTGYSTEDVCEAMVKAGAETCLSKPLNRKRLLSMVRMQEKVLQRTR